MVIEQSIKITPRISDINYGGHVGHTELIDMLHEARLVFLSNHSLNEINIDGHTLIVRTLNVVYKNQAYWGNDLQIKLSVKTDGAKIVFEYSVYNVTLANQTASAEVGMVLINRESNKPIKPDLFIKMVSNGHNTRKVDQENNND